MSLQNAWHLFPFPSGKPGADTADITAKTVADVTAHENAHVMVYQSVGRRISKYYGENVFKIKTKPYATEEEAKRKVKSMEQKSCQAFCTTWVDQSIDLQCVCSITSHWPQARGGVADAGFPCRLFC